MLNLIRIAPEVHTKSSRVRHSFINRLRKNLAAALRAAGHTFEIQSHNGRLYIESPDTDIVYTAQKVFGISSLSPLDFSTEPQMELLPQAALVFYRDQLKDKTFAVRVKRVGVSGMTSVEAERIIGAALYPYAKGVNLKNPDITIHVEVRTDKAHFFTKKIKAHGGLPLGVEGRVLCLLSGGFDSAVAAWLMMKRGTSVDFLFLNLAGAAYERQVLAVAEALHQNWSHSEAPLTHIVNFAPTADAIRSQVKPAFNQVVLKRMMYKTAAAIARRFPERQYAAIVTGESIGQVSSQTLHNLAAIDHGSEIFVLRPLIAFDKEEILRLSRMIGTHQLSESIQEYCSLTSKRPVTHTSASKLDENEQVLDKQALIQNSVDQCKTIDLGNFELKDALSEYLFCDQIPKNAKLIDVREKAQFLAWHFPGALHRPMEDLLSQFSDLAKETTYVLYCPFGLQSAVAAEKMQKAGYEAYSFRGGTQRLRKIYQQELEGDWDDDLDDET